MSDTAVYGTRSRGMVLGKTRQMGVGMIVKPFCHRCGLSRMSATHKRKCRVNPNPLWI